MLNYFILFYFLKDIHLKLTFLPVQDYYYYKNATLTFIYSLSPLYIYIYIISAESDVKINFLLSQLTPPPKKKKKNTKKTEKTWNQHIINNSNLGNTD